MELMRFDLHFEKDRSLAEVRAVGRATATGFAELDMALLEHRDWIPGMKVLFDFRELDLSGLSAADARESADFVRSLSERLGSGQFACVMGREVDFGVARMWEILTADGVSLEIRIFRSLTEARSWLHL